MDRVPVLEAGTTASRFLAGTLAHLDRHRRHQEQTSPLGVADLRLLWLFNDHRPRTLREIVDELGLERSTVNRQVNAALASGLLRRYREDGANAHLVEATPSGLQAFERGVSEILHSYDVALAEFDDHERHLLLNLFDRFVCAYGRTVHSTPTPPQP
ncbi:MarR family winged helix-turn-helix transcriptional regulator [Nocardia aurantia]|uniref:HTH marR-type domain-containing protein n=1 Tax=Nocardia aurantia TaxID=2585199 RepID=A0A7K0DME2_9NOCA|nr:MarR family transcriptional regulator [Nocardia aurantia]MQY25994.1 hypothetical protein [Nocardia aurantia]